jgi:2'-5' RNA ligase
MDISKFFIGICPPRLLEERIHGVKEEFRQKYRIQGAFRSKAHITLQMPFNLPTIKVDRFIHELNELIVRQNPIEIQLNNFGKFEPRVIFIKVEENEQLNFLQNSVERFMKRFQVFNSTHKNNGFNPHITVAFRDLKKPTFHKIWDDVKNREFMETFLADNITIFKHNGKSWEIFKELKLDNQ